MRAQGKFILYHRTSAEQARAIIKRGFRDSTGYFLSNPIWTGVWLCSLPLDSEHGTHQDALLEVKLEIDDHELARWAWAAEGRSNREWLIPANILNRCATVQLVDQLDCSPAAAEEEFTPALKMSSALDRQD